MFRITREDGDLGSARDRVPVMGQVLIVLIFHFCGGVFLEQLLESKQKANYRVGNSTVLYHIPPSFKGHFSVSNLDIFHTKIFCGWGACVLYVACSFCELRNLIEKSSWVE